MDISSTPSIRVSHHHRCQSPPSRSPSYGSYSPSAAAPMSIPNAPRESPPPPLPPPRHIEDLSSGYDQGWKWGNDPNWSDFGRAASVKPGSSLLGGKSAERDGEDNTHGEIDAARRGSSISTVTPGQRERDMTDRKSSTSSPDEDGRPSNYRSQSERQSEQRTLEDSSQAYDRNLLSKIGGPNTPHRPSVSYPSPGAGENASASPASTEGRSGQLKPSSMPERRQHSSDASISRWVNIPSSGAVSPGSFRNPLFDPENSRPSAQRHPSFPFDNSASHRSSYDQGMFNMPDEFGAEEGQMRELNIHDRSPSGSDDMLGAKAGIKRRASSPHREATREDRTSVSSSTAGEHDSYHRRSMQQLPNRISPVARYPANHGSVSSASSLGRNGSLASSHGLSSVASSATSYSSGRISPTVAMSPAIDPELGCGTQFAAVKSLNSSPRDSISYPPPHQSRTFSESSQGDARKMSTDSMSQSRQNSISSNAQGLFICECCPKKPKKFRSQEELSHHYYEKQYACAYCPNRFKNKNEAERHQNSLHLRKHSWSCAALLSTAAVFYASPGSNGASDQCGYCGMEFSNAPDANHDERRDHIEVVHKFGECNPSKKFFRADHFRQHLKHSHHGASGKWTNLLENSCMKDEPLPIPSRDRVPPIHVHTQQIQMPQVPQLPQPAIMAPPALMGAPTLSPQQSQSHSPPHQQQQQQQQQEQQQQQQQPHPPNERPGVIDEVPHES